VIFSLNNYALDIERKPLEDPEIEEDVTDERADLPIEERRETLLCDLISGARVLDLRNFLGFFNTVFFDVN